MKTIWILILLLSLAACASKQDRKFEDKSETQDLTETFDIPDDKLSKFKVSDAVVDVKSPQRKLSVPEKKEIEKVAKPKKPKTDTKRAKEQLGQIKKDLEKSQALREKEIEEAKKAIEEIEKKEQVDKEIPEEEWEEKWQKIIPLFDEWDRKSKKIWAGYQSHYSPGEEMLIEISYLNLTAGYVRLKTNPMPVMGGKPVYHYSADLKSARYYSYIYKLDDRLQVFWDPIRHLPLKYELTQRESGKDVDDLQVFDNEEKKTYFWYKRVKDNQVTKKEKSAPLPEYFQDSFSVLYFARGLELKVGEKFMIPVYSRAKVRTLTLKVNKIEEVKILDRWIPAYQVQAEAKVPGVLESKGDILFWYSTDATRKLLKFKANIKLGSIEGKLIEYRPGATTPVIGK